MEWVNIDFYRSGQNTETTKVMSASCHNYHRTACPPLKLRSPGIESDPTEVAFRLHCWQGTAIRRRQRSATTHKDECATMPAIAIIPTMRITIHKGIWPEPIAFVADAAVLLIERIHIGRFIGIWHALTELEE
jgi:hypothetical protein